MLHSTTHPSRPASFNPIGIMNSSPVHWSSNSNQKGNNGSMSSTRIVSNSTPGVHQNDIILQKSSFTAEPGLLGLSQVAHSRGVTEVRRTCIAAQGVQVGTAVNHPSVQNHSLSYITKVTTVTEVITIPNLNSPLSTMNRMLHQNGSATLQNEEPVVGDSFDTMSNQVSTFHHAKPYPQSNNAMAIIPNQVTSEMQNSQLNKVQLNSTFDKTPISLNPIGSMDSDTIQYISGSHSQMAKLDSLRNDRKFDPRLEDADVKDEKSEHTNDGITHSLPCRKYGPYTCPKCGKVFNRSQSFAAHMNYHYKTESPADRMRRQAAKYKHRNVRGGNANVRECITDTQTEVALAVKVKQEG